MQSTGIARALPLLVVLQTWSTIVWAQMGMGGMGMGGMGMGMGMGMGRAGPMAEMSLAEMGQFAMLGRAVREIVHPNARPTHQMNQIAMRQGSIPRTMPQMMEYMPHFVNLAYQHGVQPTGTQGRPRMQSMQDYLQQRAMQWVNGAGVPMAMTAGQVPPRDPYAVRPPVAAAPAAKPVAPAAPVAPIAPAAPVARPVPVAQTAPVSRPVNFAPPPMAPSPPFQYNPTSSPMESMMMMSMMGGEMPLLGGF